MTVERNLKRDIKRYYAKYVKDVPLSFVEKEIAKASREVLDSIIYERKTVYKEWYQKTLKQVLYKYLVKASLPAIQVNMMLKEMEVISPEKIEKKYQKYGQVGDGWHTRDCPNGCPNMRRKKSPRCYLGYRLSTSKSVGGTRHCGICPIDKDFI